MNKLKYLPGMILMASCLAACHTKVDGSNEQLVETVDSFAYHYFNYHLPQALRFCTPESAKWLSFVASNIRQADVDALRSQEEEAEIEYVMPDIADTDTLAAIRLTVRNHLVKDSIGKTGHFVDKASYDLQAVKHQGKWLIRLNSVPSPKRQHD